MSTSINPSGLHNLILTADEPAAAAARRRATRTEPRGLPTIPEEGTVVTGASLTRRTVVVVPQEPTTQGPDRTATFIR